MNEITIKLTTEQFAIMQKLLEPYVLLASGLSVQYSQQLQGQKLNPEKTDELEEIIARG